MFFFFYDTAPPGISTYRHPLSLPASFPISIWKAWAVPFAASSAVAMVASTVLEIIRVMVNSGNAKPVRTRGIAVVAAEAWSRGSRHGCRGVHESKIRSAAHQRMTQIGRASCRERVCQYVEISVVAITLKKKKQERKVT